MGAKVEFNLARDCEDGRGSTGREVARLGYIDEDGLEKFAEMTFAANPCGVTDQCLPAPGPGDPIPYPGEIDQQGPLQVFAYGPDAQPKCNIAAP